MKNSKNQKFESSSNEYQMMYYEENIDDDFPTESSEVTVQALCDKHRVTSIQQFMGNQYVVKHIYKPLHDKLAFGRGIVLRGPRGIGKHSLVGLCGVNGKTIIDITEDTTVSSIEHVFEYGASVIFIVSDALPSVMHWLTTHPSIDVVSMEKLSMDDIISIGSRIAVSLGEMSARASRRVCTQMVTNLAEISNGNARRFTSLLYDAAIVEPENWAARVFETRGCIESKRDIDEATNSAVKRFMADTLPLPSAKYTPSLIVNSVLRCTNTLSHALSLMRNDGDEYDERMFELLHREAPRAVDIGCNPDRMGEMHRVADSFSYADVVHETLPLVSNTAVTLAFLNRSPQHRGLLTRVTFAIERDIGTRHKYWAHETHESRRRIPICHLNRPPRWEVKEMLRTIVSRFSHNVFGKPPSIEQNEQYRSMCEAFVSSDVEYRDAIDRQLFYMDYVRTVSDKMAMGPGFTPVTVYTVPSHKENIATFMFISAADPMSKTCMPIVSLRDTFLIELQTRLVGRYIDHTLTARWLLLLVLLRPHQGNVTVLSKVRPVFPISPFAMFSMCQILIDDMYKKDRLKCDPSVLPESIIPLVPNEMFLGDVVAENLRVNGVNFVHKSKWVAKHYHIFSRVIDMDTLRMCYTQYILYKFLNEIRLIGYE